MSVPVGRSSRISRRISEASHRPKHTTERKIVPLRSVPASLERRREAKAEFQQRGDQTGPRYICTFDHVFLGGYVFELLHDMCVDRGGGTVLLWCFCKKPDLKKHYMPWCLQRPAGKSTLGAMFDRPITAWRCRAILPSRDLEAEDLAKRSKDTSFIQEDMLNCNAKLHSNSKMPAQTHHPNPYSRHPSEYPNPVSQPLSLRIFPSPKH